MVWVCFIIGMAVTTSTIGEYTHLRNIVVGSQYIFQIESPPQLVGHTA